MATTLNVRVTPTGGSGPRLKCDITGDNVTDNAIFLDRGTDYDIRLTLVPGHGVTNWDASPFKVAKGKCPRGKPPAPGTTQDGFTADPPAGNVLTVHAAAHSKRRVAHYKLKFNGGYSCDPIIINQ